ncbi:MAG: PKD domain-containing protein [Methylococcales bacterium]
MRILLIKGILILFCGISHAGSVNLAWDAVSSPDLGGYQIHYGNRSNRYLASVDVGNETSHTIQGLQDGAEYYFSVKAYSLNRTIASNFSNEVSTIVTSPVTADFSVNPVSGTAPFIASFTDTSTGNITNWNWDFGDGTKSTAPIALKSYGEAGTYTVSLTVTGPNGTDTRTMTNPITVTDSPPVTSLAANITSGIAPISADLNHLSKFVASNGANPSDVFEAGSLNVTDKWTYVPFARSFKDPVVVAGSLSYNGKDPSVASIRNVGQTGFEARIQEWDYLDDKHTVETLNYLIMERGHHTLGDGTQVEAGSVVTDRIGPQSFESVIFAETFNVNPVVLTTLNTMNEGDAVTTRVRNIQIDGFQLQMQEQEANIANHIAETISYIAWEPSIGNSSARDFEANLTTDNVTHNSYHLSYQQQFVNPPIILLGMQTVGDADAANLRWSANDEFGVDLRVTEEQSKDSEIFHTTEIVGYLVFSQ